MRIVLLVFLTFTFGTLAFSQLSFDIAEEKTKSKLLDLSSATYRLMAKRRAVGFFNYSAVAVKGFRLGCVEKKENKLLILSERDFQEFEIAAATEDRISSWMIVANHGLFPLEECETGKLAVIEVALANGITWKLTQ